MSILAKLEAIKPYQGKDSTELAAFYIAIQKDPALVQELVDNLKNKSSTVQSDCIKILYELGKIRPEMISYFAFDFLALLDSTNNRLQWGAMTTLDYICQIVPDTIYEALPKIIEKADSGSVITRDHAVNILIQLCQHEEYAGYTFPLLIAQLKVCPINQLPMYAEYAEPIINAKNKTVFVKTLTARLGEIDKESKKYRIEQVIKKLSK